jgi:hypothetical protein
LIFHEVNPEHKLQSACPVGITSDTVVKVIQLQ